MRFKRSANTLKQDFCNRSLDIRHAVIDVEAAVEQSIESYVSTVGFSIFSEEELRYNFYLNVTHWASVCFG